MEENIDPQPAIIVIDASVILAKLLPDEGQISKLEHYYIQFAANKLDFAAPVLLKFELTNALRSSVLRKRVSEEAATRLLKEVLKLPIYYSALKATGVAQRSPWMKMSERSEVAEGVSGIARSHGRSEAESVGPPLPRCFI